MTLLGGIFFLVGGVIMMLRAPRKSQGEYSVTTFLMPGALIAALGPFFLYQAVSEFNS
jgi:hypothetical protein